MKHATSLILASLSLLLGNVAPVSAGLIFDSPIYPDGSPIYSVPNAFASSSGGASTLGGTIFSYDDFDSRSVDPNSPTTTATQSGSANDDRASTGGSASATTSLTLGSNSFIFPSLTATANQFARVSNQNGSTQSSGTSIARNSGFFELSTSYNFVFTMNLTDFTVSATSSGLGDRAFAQSGASFLLESLSYPYDPFSEFSNFVFIGTSSLTAESRDGSAQSLVSSGYKYNYYNGMGKVVGFNSSITLTGVLGPGVYQYIMSGSAHAEASGSSAYAVANDPVSFDLVLTPASVPEPSTLALLGVGAMGLLGGAWRKRRARAA
jgi:hypothetical protein